MGHFSHKQNFLGGVAVLTMAVVVVKLISAVYKIPLGNLLDDEGMGHFNIAYNVYNFSPAVVYRRLSPGAEQNDQRGHGPGALQPGAAPVPCGGSPVFVLGAAASAVMFFAPALWRS